MNLFRKILFQLLFVCFSCSVALAQGKVKITVDTRAAGPMIPKDFIGVSFETASLRYDVSGVHGYLFDSSDTEMVTLFRELGIKNLRIGGGTVDMPNINPTHANVNALFRFAKAAGVKVIYSFKLLNGNAKKNASMARYIWKHYSEYLDCFAIGNEPDWHSYHLRDPQIRETVPGVPGTAFPSYLAKWKRFATTILDSVPGAKFTGPDAGSNYPVLRAKDTYYDGKPWTVNFADDLVKWHSPNSGSLKFVSQHNYVGQDAKAQHLSPQVMVDRMLSPDWDAYYYPALYNAVGTPALPKGVGYRMTESNSFSGGVKNGSDCFATALYALDYLHWWAAHGCLGVNFHTTQWRYNGTFYLDKDGQYQVHPMAYGIKAFDLGGHGEVKPVEISNPNGLNVTAYAVKGRNYLYVTIINKEHGDGAPEADAVINTGGVYGKAAVMFLAAADGNALSTSGIVLGGAPITNEGPWEGQWTVVRHDRTEVYRLRVPPHSAAILRIK